MKNSEDEYYIGLDIGTGSVGWAVTDTSYNLIRKRGKDMWGSYLFDEAQTAAERRMFRTSRRRGERTHQRLMLLQEIFAEEIEKADPLFFIRLNSSSLFSEDKDERLTTDDCLFADSGYKDRDFHKDYPTIYHLRKAMREGEIKDVRLLYLAIHHIVKKRGHFLFENQTFGVSDREAVKQKFFDANAFLSDNELPALELRDLDAVLDILSDTKLSKSKKKLELQTLLGVEKGDRCASAVVGAVCGLKFSLKNLFDLDEAPEGDGCSFDAPDFEESVLPAISDGIGEESANFILTLKSIYDWMTLCNVMNGKPYISDAKVEQYERHGNDLRALKEHVRLNYPEKYSLVFHKRAKTANYAAYIGSDNGKGLKKCAKKDFYAFIKREIPGDEYIEGAIEDGTFMPLLSSKDNSVIPYQINLMELEAILDNAERQFPFLSEKKDGYTAGERIEMLMTFRVPYYVGPLCSDSKFSWAQRREGQEKMRVTPWNFDDVIDRDASEDRFIGRMTGKCTYLKDQDVLPANSLLYSEYVFRDELNNLKIDGEKNARAREIVYDYALHNKKVTLKACLERLKEEGVVPMDAETDIFSGTDGDFRSSLAPFVDFERILGDKLYSHREMCEEIIKWITIVSDKTRLEKRIRDKYGNVLSDAEIKGLKGLNYSKWGRLSKELLDGIKSSRCTDEDGAELTIIEKMRSSDLNFMSVYFDCGFDDVVDERNKEFASESVTYKTIQEMCCSPAVKRSIWRSVVLVKEIVKICGRGPKKIFIEMGRDVKDEDRKGRRTKTRKQQLLDLYKNVRDDERDWKREIEATSDGKFDSDRLFLYYLQKGRCMYSGRDIPLSDVFKTNVCDIDHIHPRSKVKDDSLDNKVLVYKTENMQKGDVYPLAPDVRERMRTFWSELKCKGFISWVKYARLVSTSALTQDYIADFINRQLSFTRQSTKAVAETMKVLLKKYGTEVVYAKAGNADEFKQKYGIVKIRELNDLHHAKDAYVNIVVGNVYNTLFGHDAKFFFKKKSITRFNLTKIYDSDIDGAWHLSDLDKILETVERNRCSVVYMTESEEGQMFDVNVKGGGATNKYLLPLKEDARHENVRRYGGYGKIKSAYFMIVRSVGANGNAKLSIIGYPLYLEKKYPSDLDRKLQYCASEYNLVNPEIVLDDIKRGTLISVNDAYAYIRSSGGPSDPRIVLCSAVELYLEKENMATLKKISNYMADRKKFNNKNLDVRDDVTPDEILSLYDEFAEKLGGIYKNLWPRKDYSRLLVGSRGVFTGLQKKDQYETLYEILKLMQCKLGFADLSRIGGYKLSGTIRMDCDITSSGMKIIYQSPTGYYSRVIDTKDFL